MKVLNSAKAFREHYATRAPSVFSGAKALAAGGALATSVTGASAFAAGTAAAQASAWSTFVGWPLIGTIAICFSPSETSNAPVPVPIKEIVHSLPSKAKYLNQKNLREA